MQCGLHIHTRISHHVSAPPSAVAKTPIPLKEASAGPAREAAGLSGELPLARAVRRQGSPLSTETRRVPGLRVPPHSPLPAAIQGGIGGMEVGSHPFPADLPFTVLICTLPGRRPTPAGPALAPPAPPREWRLGLRSAPRDRPPLAGPGPAPPPARRRGCHSS